MICWSCQKKVPDNAQFCPHCEAEVVTEPFAEEEAAAASVLAAMSPDLLDELRDAFDASATGEEFVNRIMVGDCPQCGSSKTSHCENDPEIDVLASVAASRADSCGALIAGSCSRTLNPPNTTVPPGRTWTSTMMTGTSPIDVVTW